MTDKKRKESTGRPCLEGVRLVSFNATVLPSQREWLFKNGGSKKIRELLEKAMNE